MPKMQQLPTCKCGNIVYCLL